ncbi:unnamed protein product, partial [Leptidea sinapis]
MSTPIAKRPQLRWRDNDVIKFINNYKILENLWNPKHSEYKNKMKREKAYETLRDVMEIEHLTVHDVRNKIKGIRTSYSDELNKIRASRQPEGVGREDERGRGEGYVPRLFWFSLADSFLRPVTEHRRELQAVHKISPNDPLLIAHEEIQVKEEPMQTEEQCDAFEAVECVGSESPAPVPPQEWRGRPGRLQHVIRRLERLAESLSETTGAAMSPIGDRKTACSGGEDEFDLFGRALALQLRRLPELDALQV